ncbi:MAG: hypothetical protein WBC82_00835 [Dehalococcoidia bacterium]
MNVNICGGPEGSSPLRGPGGVSQSYVSGPVVGDSCYYEEHQRRSNPGEEMNKGDTASLHQHRDSSLEPALSAVRFFPFTL